MRPIPQPVQSGLGAVALPPADQVPTRQGPHPGPPVPLTHTVTGGWGRPHDECKAAAWTRKVREKHTHRSPLQSAALLALGPVVDRPAGHATHAGFGLVASPPWDQDPRGQPLHVEPAAPPAPAAHTAGAFVKVLEEMLRLETSTGVRRLNAKRCPAGRCSRRQQDRRTCAVCAVGRALCRGRVVGRAAGARARGVGQVAAGGPRAHGAGGACGAARAWLAEGYWYRCDGWQFELASVGRTRFPTVCCLLHYSAVGPWAMGQQAAPHARCRS